MKVVLFCGGLGLRLREYSHELPKPMVPIGGVPVLLHVMQYYAHFGHTDFVLALGYKGDVIERYFFERGAEPLSSQPQRGEDGLEWSRAAFGDWTVTFAHTGSDVNIGGRLLRVRSLVDQEEIFLANYSDDLTDAPLNDLIAEFRQQEGVVGSFLSVKPNLSLHAVSTDGAGRVTDIVSVRDAGIRVNGGYFIFRRSIFDVLFPGEELVEEPFARLMENGALMAHDHQGFWGPLDTLKDHQVLEDLELDGRSPWKLWLTTGNRPATEDIAFVPGRAE
ncbi:MAG: sugar phosphate nucleotidyltransferase [Deinococcales bacterium]